MIFKKKPENFNKKFDIVSCFVLWQDKFLLLQRQERKSEPKQRGLPAGKVEINEYLKDAMMRELQEETGMLVKSIKGKVKIDQLDFIEQSDNTSNEKTSNLPIFRTGRPDDIIQKEYGSQEKDFLFGKLHTTFVRYPNYDFEYHEFVLDKFVNDDKSPKVVLNKNEHCNYKRILPNEALTLDLMPDLDWFVRRFFGIEF